MQNGLIGPYKKFLSGESTVNVKIMVDSAGVTVEEIPEIQNQVPIMPELPKVVMVESETPIEIEDNPKWSRKKSTE